jgi:hypothetical protein
LLAKRDRAQRHFRRRHGASVSGGIHLIDEGPNGRCRTHGGNRAGGDEDEVAACRFVGRVRTVRSCFSHLQSLRFRSAAKLG